MPHLKLRLDNNPVPGYDGHKFQIQEEASMFRKIVVIALVTLAAIMAINVAGCATVKNAIDTVSGYR